MDKEKIKIVAAEVKVITEELVASGTLDGDQARQILFEFTEDALRKEYMAELTEV